MGKLSHLFGGIFAILTRAKAARDREKKIVIFDSTTLRQQLFLIEAATNTPSGYPECIATPPHISAFTYSKEYTWVTGIDVHCLE